MTKEIPLNHGMVAIVDDWNFERAMQHKWSAVKRRHTFYAITKINGKQIFLHNFLFLEDSNSDEIMDHVNGDGLNCVSTNMRKATYQQNTVNRRRLSTNKSGYKGVSWDKKNSKWVAHIDVAGKSKNLGRFSDKETAARTFDAAAIENFGEFARINFPAEHPEYPYQQA